MAVSCFFKVFNGSNTLEKGAVPELVLVTLLLVGPLLGGPEKMSNKSVSFVLKAFGVADTERLIVPSLRIGDGLAERLTRRLWRNDMCQ